MPGPERERGEEAAQLPASQLDRSSGVVADVAEGRLTRALGLAFEHFDEFGVDLSVVELLRASIGRRRDASLSTGLRQLLDRPARGRAPASTSAPPRGPGAGSGAPGPPS